MNNNSVYINLPNKFFKKQYTALKNQWIYGGNNEFLHSVFLKILPKKLAWCEKLPVLKFPIKVIILQYHCYNSIWLMFLNNIPKENIEYINWISWQQTSAFWTNWERYIQAYNGTKGTCLKRKINNRKGKTPFVIWSKSWEIHIFGSIKKVIIYSGFFKDAQLETI